jgi:chromosome segregation ATPase
LKEQYENQMQEALDSFNHDACKAERREMEQRFLTQFRGKEEQVQELMRENEGCKLRIDALKREVEGTQALLEQRDSIMGSVNASHSKNIELLEQRIQELNNTKSLAKAETNRVKEELQAIKSELSTSNEAYSSLKARVKVVATELKERRIECRSLAGTVAELKQSNEELETQVANLQSQLSDRDKSQTEKDKDVLKLREQMESLELELHKTKSELKDRDSVGEKALSSYKRKAQNALAVANARAAAANQAKEEAELEATTARTMSEEAIQRATITENAGKKALAEAKEYVREMESEKEGLEKKLSQVCESLETIRAESEHLKNCLDASRVAQEKLAEDLKLITRDREEERGKNRELQRQLAENQQKLELLYEEVETLREDLRQANATVAASSSNDNSEKESRPTVWTHTTRASDELPDRSDAEGTIAMLEGDLRDANRAIKELKDALKNAIAVHGSNGYGNGMQPGHYHGNPQHASAADTAGNESTPLFYAMEKQAELNTARDEINRLANLLGDAESAKMEAFEAMDEMRRRMEEAEARLNRQEKFEGASRPTAAASTTTPSANDNANLEYLKNIMLSYLNAKSLTEKKALVPVIAAVLCLTPEEQATAVKNIDESGGLEVVGRTLFESLGGSLGR